LISVDFIWAWPFWISAVMPPPQPPQRRRRVKAFGVRFKFLSLSDRISMDPAVCHGKPVVRGTRVLVANVVGAIAAGQSHAEILEDYPSLTSRPAWLSPVN
jgi:uncharacterized protein (DUF433 family)